MSDNADASEDLPSDSGSIDGSDMETEEELSIGEAYKNLKESALVVSTWVVESSKDTRHLELRVQDLSTKLAVVISTMAALILNPQHSESPSFYSEYRHVVATYDDLSEHCAISSVVDKKRRRLLE